MQRALAIAQAANQGAAGFIFDGFPRTVGQAGALDELLKSRGSEVNRVIRLVVDDEQLLARVTKRFEEQGRKDDNPEVFEERLREYYKKTAPLTGYYYAKGMLKTVDGMASIDDVTAALRKVIES